MNTVSSYWVSREIEDGGASPNPERYVTVNKRVKESHADAEYRDLSISTHSYRLRVRLPSMSSPGTVPDLATLLKRRYHSWGSSSRCSGWICSTPSYRVPQPWRDRSNGSAWSPPLASDGDRSGGGGVGRAATARVHRAGAADATRSRVGRRRLRHRGTHLRGDSAAGGDVGSLQRKAVSRPSLVFRCGLSSPSRSRRALPRKCCSAGIQSSGWPS